jgi:serine/threonine protein kinase
MAPESFEANVYNEKSEIWALGVILYECLTGKTMDDGRHMSEVYLEI